MRVGGETTPLTGGDIIMLPHGDAHVLGNGTGAQPINGEDNIAEILNADDAAFSAVVDDMLSELVGTTSDQLKKVGNSLGGNAVEVDEFGQSPTQKDVPGYFVGFPLRKIQFAIGWTRQFFKNAQSRGIGSFAASTKPIGTSALPSGRSCITSASRWLNTVTSRK